MYFIKSLALYSYLMLVTTSATQYAENNIVKLNNKEYNLNNLDRFTVSTSNAKYFFEGEEETFPFTSIFSKDFDNEILLVNYDDHDQVNRVSVVSKDTGLIVGSLESLGNGEFFDSLLNEGVEAPTINEHVDEQTSLRGALHKQQQKKRITCDSYDTIDVNISYEASYCKEKGGEFATMSEITYMMALGSLRYEYNGSCKKLRISSLDGSCEQSNAFTNTFSGEVKAESGLSVERV